VTTTSFDVPMSSCPNCATGSSLAPMGGSTFTQPYTPAPTPAGETPQPQLDQSAPVPEQRLRPLPDNSVLEDNGPTSPASPLDNGGTDTFNSDTGPDAFWQAPQLFNPNARTTARPAMPVWTAVYEQDGNSTAASQAVYHVGPDASVGSPVGSVSAAGDGGSVWRSVRN
ncbi:MAG: hypothetical protein AAGG46_11305, partial [Planctomycetota bacterium]